ncbi:MAG: hypothetical protein V4666_00080 [Bacteroidota bacterium]
MNILKSTLESFKENELTKMHKLNVYGGLTDGGSTSIPLDELEEPIDDGSGDPASGTGPRGTGGSNSGAAVATLGNTNGGNLLPTGK